MMDREQPAPLLDLESLAEVQYEDFLHGLIVNSAVLPLEDIQPCVHSLEPPPDLSDTDKSVCVCGVCMFMHVCVCV